MKEWKNSLSDKPGVDLGLAGLAKERGYTTMPLSASSEDRWLEWRDRVRIEESSYFSTVFDPFVTFAHPPPPDFYNVGPGKGLPEIFFLRGYRDLLSVYTANTEQYVALAKRFAPRGFVEQERKQELLIEHISMKNQVEHFGQQHQKPMKGVKAVLKVLLKETEAIQGKHVFGILSTMPDELVDAHECVRYMIRALWNAVIQGVEKPFIPHMFRPTELIECGRLDLARLWMAQMEGVFHYVETRDVINTKAARLEPKWRAYEALVQAATLDERVPRWEEVRAIEEEEWPPTKYEGLDLREVLISPKLTGLRVEFIVSRLYSTCSSWNETYDKLRDLCKHLGLRDVPYEDSGSMQRALRQYLKRQKEKREHRSS